MAIVLVAHVVVVGNPEIAAPTPAVVPGTAVMIAAPVPPTAPEVAVPIAAQVGEGAAAAVAISPAGRGSRFGCRRSISRGS